MGFKCGIVGLPNVGKSTLFNALTSTQAAQAANYPFCTIEPNVGRVEVPDTRLHQLAKIAGSAKIIPTQIEFIDIAGIVKGASKGEGLGNQFLSHIREVDAIVHVVRCFEDGDITHVEGSVDPLRDAEIIELELVLADLESVEKRIVNLQKKSKGGDKESVEQMELLQAMLVPLKDGKPARTAVPKGKEKQAKALQLITTKPMMYVCNVKDHEIPAGNKYSEIIAAKATKENAKKVVICAKIEEEIANLGSSDEKKEFLESLGLSESGLTQIIREGYELLHLTTFFTIGPKEARAWTVHKGALAPEAAGAIHTDFEKGFIRAETISCADYIQYNGESGARDAGKLRLEGKEYVTADGDVFHFRFNV